MNSKKAQSKRNCSVLFIFVSASEKEVFYQDFDAEQN